MARVKLVLYGKGGVGKSTIATHLSAACAKRGHRVLHVGCDPKMDSSLRLTGSEDVPYFVDFIEDQSVDSRTPADLIVRGKWDIDTIEAGGPEAGIGCAGRGVASLLHFMEVHDMDSWPYDTMVFDVLGDLVCGGFVAPLRWGAGNRVFIVASGELMSLFAANRIARVVLDHADEDVRLGGLICNVKILDDRVRAGIERFADRINTRVVAYVPWDRLVKEAERENQTVFEYAPHSPVAEAFRGLADAVLEEPSAQSTDPTPMDRREFMRFGRSLDL